MLDGGGVEHTARDEGAAGHLRFHCSQLLVQANKPTTTTTTDVVLGGNLGEDPSFVAHRVHQPTVAMLRNIHCLGDVFASASACKQRILQRHPLLVGELGGRVWIKVHRLRAALCECCRHGWGKKSPKRIRKSKRRSLTVAMPITLHYTTPHHLLWLVPHVEMERRFHFKKAP